MKTFVSMTYGRRLIAAVIIGVAVAFSSLLAQAQSITGGINFTGGADLNGSLTAATAYTGFFNSAPATMPSVLGGSQSGSYASVPSGTQVTFSSFTFAPFTTAPQTLWTFTTGGTTYSFKATTLTEMSAPGFLNLQGTGIASISGNLNFADTAATWSYTDTGTGSGPAFNFGGSISAIPEPSTTSLLIVLALIGGVSRIATRSKSCLRAGVS